MTGKSFNGTGIEILLHNLVNPTKSVIAIENKRINKKKKKKKKKYFFFFFFKKKIFLGKFKIIWGI